MTYLGVEGKSEGRGQKGGDKSHCHEHGENLRTLWVSRSPRAHRDRVERT